MVRDDVDVVWDVWWCDEVWCGEGGREFCVVVKVK